MITMQMIEDFRQELYETRDPSSLKSVATRVLVFLPVTFKAVTDRSFKDLFSYIFDHWHRNSLGEYEPAFTVGYYGS